MPDLSLEMISRQEWKMAAIQAKKMIKQRTQEEKVDYKRRPFKAYSEDYKKLRLRKGRNATPDLTFSGKMLTAMSPYSTAKKGAVVYSGFYSKIARGNEARGRIFFALSSSDETKILKMVDKWMAKKNGLK
jgi:hypothetical protein